MSDDPIGACCAIALVACLDVYGGICIDFASVRASSFRLPLPVARSDPAAINA